MREHRLPPKNIWLSLPALTPSEADVLLSIVDELQNLLWEAYGEHLVDSPTDEPDPTTPSSDAPPDDTDF